jgi:phosphoglycerate-specific signal transduction histidine kinase
MAGPFEATATSRSSIWRRAAFGVGGKLQWAFSIVAGLTAISTVVSLLCFSAVEAGLRNFANRQMPIVSNVMQLSAISGEISAAAARLINARTSGDQKAIAALIARKRADLAEALQQLEKLDSANSAVAKLDTLSQRLNANLSALEDIITERSDLRTQIAKLDDTLHQTHARLVDRLAQLPDSRAALEVSARAHLLVSLIGEASSVREPTQFKHIQDLLKTASDRLRESAVALADDDISKITAQLLPLGVGANSIFARHARETFVATRADATIDENVAIQRGMDQTVANLVNAAQQGVEHSTAGLTDTLGRSRVLLLIVAFISIIAAAVVGAFYVQRRLVRRLLSISDAMRLLAAGDVDTALPAVQSNDEMGEMARSLHVLRAGELERRKLLERERAEQITERQRVTSIDRIIEDFPAP